MTNETDRIGAARRAYADLEPRVMDGEPWPLAADYGTGPEASWGPREVLAHVEEMLPFWLGEMERVIDGPVPGPTAFGRTADDSVRIAIIDRDRSLPLRVLFGRVDQGLAAWANRLAALTDEERARVGLHPRLGEMAAGDIAQRFIIGHAEEHVAQLTEALSSRAS